MVTEETGVSGGGYFEKQLCIPVSNAEDAVVLPLLTPGAFFYRRVQITSIHLRPSTFLS